jgi:hypothetical protein
MTEIEFLTDQVECYKTAAAFLFRRADEETQRDYVAMVQMSGEFLALPEIEHD